MYADQQMFGMGGGEGNDIIHTVMAFMCDVSIFLHKYLRRLKIL